VNENGTLSASANGKPVSSGAEIEHGTVVEFTAIPDDNYIVKEWIHNDIVIADTTNNFEITVTDDETVTVEFRKLIGIKKNKLSAVEIFPNPVTNKLFINNAEQIQKIVIHNLLGQVVIDETPNGKKSVVVSTQSLQQGMFFITLKNFDGDEITKKIVKQ